MCLDRFIVRLIFCDENGSRQILSIINPRAYLCCERECQTVGAHIIEREIHFNSNSVSTSDFTCTLSENHQIRSPIHEVEYVSTRERRGVGRSNNQNRFQLNSIHRSSNEIRELRWPDSLSQYYSCILIFRSSSCEWTESSTWNTGEMCKFDNGDKSEIVMTSSSCFTGQSAAEW